MWNLVLKNKILLLVFWELGNTTDDVISTLEEFVCCLYGDPKIKKVDKLSEVILNQIQGRQEKC